MTQPTDTCPYCIDGMTPSTSAHIGPCYRVCLACQPTCSCCAGTGAFPPLRDMTQFLLNHNDAGILPVLCHTCGGVVDLHPLTEEQPS